MPLSRRAFLAALGASGAAAWALLGRGREPMAALSPLALRQADRALAKAQGLIRLDSNENPNGPVAKVFEAFRSAFGGFGRTSVKRRRHLTPLASVSNPRSDPSARSNPSCGAVTRAV